MRVRQQRLEFFQNWLRQFFWVALTPNQAGVRALNRWGNKYAGLLRKNWGMIAQDPNKPLLFWIAGQHPTSAVLNGFHHNIGQG
jgi:hypothetical protein